MAEEHLRLGLHQHGLEPRQARQEMAELESRFAQVFACVCDIRYVGLVRVKAERRVAVTDGEHPYGVRGSFGEVQLIAHRRNASEEAVLCPYPFHYCD
jgi:hypothetical protein